MDNLTPFAERLFELMQDKGLSNLQLEKESGCPNTTVSAWLTKNVYPKRENLIKLSRYFYCSIDYLLGLTDDKKIDISNSPVSFKERFVSLVKEKRVTYYRVHKDCIIPSNYISRWLSKNLVPDVSTIIKLAAYFNCSTDYLLGSSDRK